jgi:dihydropteroate synthase
VVRIVEAGLGEAAPVRLVVSGLDDPDAFRAAWAPSGASIERIGDRLHATSTTRALTRAAGRALARDRAALLIAAVQTALDAWLGPTPAWQAGSQTLTFDDGPALMGVINVTPDSFSDGGRLYPTGHPEVAIGAGRRLVAEGAHLLDVGGESTRPGGAEVERDEELARVVPVIKGLSADGHLVSVDTRKPVVAQAAVEAGAVVVNDVSGARDDDLLEVVADTGVGYVLMHSRATPADMQEHIDYDDVVAEVYEYLASGIERCVAAGIALERIVIDPGIGFAKTVDHNLVLIGALRQLRSLGRPVLVGASRKSFIGKVLDQADPAERLEGGLACAALASQAGVAILRVHDVAPTTRVTRMVTAIGSASHGI